MCVGGSESLYACLRVRSCACVYVCVLRAVGATCNHPHILRCYFLLSNCIVCMDDYM